MSTTAARYIKTLLAEIAKMDEVEGDNYQESLKGYWDLRSAFDTDFAAGKAEGKKETQVELTGSFTHPPPRSRPAFALTALPACHNILAAAPPKADL